MTTVGNEKIFDQYIRWLADKVCDEEHRYEEYSMLFYALHNQIFVWRNPSDEDREKDGIDLRREYAEQQKTDICFMLITFGPCTTLEMMVALAQRTEIEITVVKEIEPARWFWAMISNLGLLGQTDDMFDPDEVSETLMCLLTKDYDVDGTGGLFRLVNYGGDVRRLNIWQQMNLYVEENF